MFTVARPCALVITVVLAGVLETSAIAQVYSVTDLGSLGTDPTGAHGVNNAGAAVGQSQTLTQAVHACLFQDGDVIDLGTLGGALSYAEKINDAGQIVGYAADRFQDQHAFLWQDGEMTDHGTLGGCCSRAVAINAAEQVAGDSDTRASPHAFLHTTAR
jgi:probable HAF family extracellular repeat protein